MARSPAERGRPATRPSGARKASSKKASVRPAPAKKGRPRKSAPPSPRRRRYAVVYDIEGPRVRLGMAWFVLAFTALVIGPLTAALCYGAAAAIAAAQTGRVWRRERLRPSLVVAAAGAGAMGIGSVLGAGGLGLALLGSVVAALVAASGDGRSRFPMLHDAGWTLQCAVPVGLVAGSMVLLVRLEVGAALSLLALVSAYEIGDYLVGSGASNPYEGPVAGGAAIIVVTFIIAALAVPPFEFGTAWAFGASVAVLAPLGQLAASALLPDAGSPASGLRRLDSLLLAAPVWAWLVGLLIEGA